MWFNGGLEEKNTNSEVHDLYRLPFDARPRNVKLNLSIDDSCLYKLGIALAKCQRATIQNDY